MSYRYACADFTFPLVPHDAVIKLISLLGFNGVDIGLFQNRSHIQPSMVFDKPGENGRLLKKKTDDAGIVVADVFLQSDLDFAKRAINHPDAKIREEERRQFERTMEYAVNCAAPHVTCLPGVHFDGESYEASFGRAAEELAWRVEMAKEANLIFGIEAHLGSVVDTPSKAKNLLDSVEGLTLTLDYTHFTKIGMPDSEVEPLIPYASHFHARGARENALQVVKAENTIDYERIVAQMKKAGYAGFIGIEYIWMEWEGCNRNDNVSECVMLMELMKNAEK